MGEPKESKRPLRAETPASKTDEETRVRAPPVDGVQAEGLSPRGEHEAAEQTSLDEAQAKHECFQIAFENAAGGMAIISPTGRFLRVNRGLCDLLGRSADELLQLTCQQVIHPESPDDDPECLQPLLTGLTDVLQADARIDHPTAGTRLVRFRLTIGTGEAPGSTFIIGHLEDLTQRKAAEEELRESEERFRKVFEEGQYGIGLVNPDHRIFRVNPAFCRIIGYSEGEVLNRTFDELTHPDDVALDASLADSLFRGEIPYYQIEKRYIPKSGGSVWVNLTASVIRDVDGTPRYAVGMVEDITDRKRSSLALERSEAYLADSQRLSRTGSFAWDVATNEFTYWSRELCRILGSADADAPLLGGKWQEVIHPDDRERVVATFASALENKTDLCMGFRIQHKDRSTNHLHAILHPVLNASGEVVELLGTCMDVTEQQQDRRALEQALDEIKKSEMRLRGVIDTIPALVESSLPDGTIEFFNRQWKDYFGPEIGDLRNADWTALIHPEDYPVVQKQWRDGVATGNGFEIELRMKRFDGAYRWILCRLAPLRDESGTIQKWYSTGVDIEDRKRAEQKLRVSESRYRHIVEDQIDFVVRWIPGGMRTFANRAYCDYLGEPYEQVIGSSFYPYIHPDDRIDVHQRLKALSPDDSVSIGEHRVVLKDGTVRWNEWTDRALFDEEGNLLEIQSVGRDITERKNAETRAQEAALTTARFSLLSKREREVLDLVVAGNANKVVAQRLQITERTVEKHRANVMKKLQARSSAELVRFALLAQYTTPAR